MVRGYLITAGIKLAPRILFSQMTFLRRYSRHPERTPLEVRYKKVRKLIVKIVETMKIDVKVNGLDFLRNQEGSFLGISNHRNFFDPLFYMYLSEKPVSFIAKKEAFKIPFVSRVMKAVDAFSIDRDDVMNQFRLFRAVADRLSKNDLSYFIFAEGTRMRDPNQIHTLPFKDGSIKPAYWAHKDIIFAATYGTHLMTMKKPKGYKIRNITIEFHKPLKYEDYKNQKTTQVMPLIENITNKTLVKIAKENDSRNLK